MARSVKSGQNYLEKKEEAGSEEMQGEYISGAPERSRTSNRLIRSQILYPVELRVLFFCSVYGIRTRDLRLERAMSWATRRTRQVLVMSHNQWAL